METIQSTRVTTVSDGCCKWIASTATELVSSTCNLNSITACESIPKYIFYCLSLAPYSLGVNFVRILYFCAVAAWQSQIDGMKAEMESQCSQISALAARRWWQWPNERLFSRKHIYVKLNHWHSMVIWLITFTRHWIDTPMRARAVRPQIVRMEIEFASSSDTWDLRESQSECVEWNVCCATNRNYYIKLRWMEIS